MQIKNLGLLSYENAYQLQKETVDRVIQGGEDTLLVCSHPSIVTLGKKSKPEDIVGWEGDIKQIERGGQATYHGPSQVIIYPIINLKNYGQNIAGFLSAMEESMISLLNSFGLNASGNPKRGEPEYTGVWVGPYKVASIGVAIKRWVSYHGLALNLHHDPMAFKGINPCGFSSSTMTSLESLLGPDHPTREIVENELALALKARIQAL